MHANVFVIAGFEMHAGKPNTSRCITVFIIFHFHIALHVPVKIHL